MFIRYWLEILIKIFKCHVVKLVEVLNKANNKVGNISLTNIKFFCCVYLDGFIKQHKNRNFVVFQ